MDVSIVIVSYNTCRILDECIASIERETAVSYEVIVVDNASVDGSCRMLREKYPEVLLIENRENAGFARANNQGFAIARGKYFFMLNSDTVILDRAIDKLVNFMDKNADVGICGPRNIGRDGKIQYNCDHFPGFWNSFCSYANLMNLFPNVKMFRRSQMQYWDYGDMKDVERIMGCSLLIRAELCRRLGGLDNNYFMYFEETDLCLRTIRSGLRIVYVPSALIIHYGGESSRMQSKKSVINKTVYPYFLASQYYFYRKNYGLFPMFTIRGLDLGYGLALLAKNMFRREKASRKDRMAKGQALCAGAVTGAVPVVRK